jgi:ribosomal-protein-alanine N-acetyltransferase
MARIHAAAFDAERPWTENEIATLIGKPFVAAFSTIGGFALTQTVAGESELLTLAVDPQHRRKGIAQGLITRWIAALPTDTEAAFLEVAADNDGARALYAANGFQQTGLRKTYYARAAQAPADALILSRRLTQGLCMSARS